MTSNSRAAVITALGGVIAAIITVAGAYYCYRQPAPSPVTTTSETTSPPPKPTARVTVAIQLPRGNSRTLAEQVRSNLLKAGHEVPAIIPVAPSLAPATIELRYFRPLERAQADQVVDELKEWGVSADLKFRGEAELQARAPLNQVELWFPASRPN